MGRIYCNLALLEEIILTFHLFLSSCKFILAFVTEVHTTVRHNELKTHDMVH